MKVERKVPVEYVRKIPVPQPVIQIESVIAEPQHIHADELEHSHHHHHHHHHKHTSHRKHKRHNPHPFIQIESLHIARNKPIHHFGNQPQHPYKLSHFRRKRPVILNLD